MKSNSVAFHRQSRREATRFNWRAWCTGLAAFALLPLMVSAQTITSAVPGAISYQGKVSNAAGALVGAGTPVNRTIVFRIWSHQSNSTVSDLVYSEQQTVTISEGEFSVLIGSGGAVSGTPLGYDESAKGPPSTTVASSAVFGGATRYLGVTIDDPATTADPEVSPRQQLVTSAYAFRAKYAEALGSNGGGSLTVADNGNVGLGTAAPGFPLSFPSTLGDKIALYGASGASYGFGVQGSLLQVHTTGASDDIAFGYGSSAAMTETMRIKGNGYVGIGVSTPGAAGGAWSKARLAVDGNIALRGEAGGNDWANQRLLFGGDGGGWSMSFNSVTNLGVINSAVMTLKDNGLVGIGTSTPSTALDVKGAISLFDGVKSRNAGVFASSNGAIIDYGVNEASTNRFGGSYTQADQGGLVRVNSTALAGSLFSFYGRVAGATALNELLSITSAGRAGIGTNSPTTKLDVRSGAISLSDGATKTRNAGISSEFSGQIINIGVNDTLNNRFGGDYTQSDPGGFLRVDSRGAGANLFTFFGRAANAIPVSEYFAITPDGAVGIGTGTPTQAKLVVSGGATSGLTSIPAGFNFDPDGQRAEGAQNGTVSIWASSRIVAQEFHAVSDQRIKTITGRSDGRADLATIMSVEVTDYVYRDAKEMGSAPHKKVIAQQVEKVFPQAVRRSTNPVPDIYRMAELRDGWIVVATDLKKGDRVKLIADAGPEVHEVVEAETGRFRTAVQPKGDKVFVYGREVSDFRTVDYEAISMLNVSATQELKRENDALIKRVAELEMKDRVRDAKIASIEKLLQSSQTVMARPAKPATANGQE